jgi:signal peptidase I
MRLIALLLVVFLIALPFFSSFSITEKPTSSNAQNIVEKPSPYDWIKEDNIKVYSSKVIIDVPGLQWSKFTDTNSMDPVFDKGANALETEPKNHSDIHVGDIISYSINSFDGIIIHRVIETGFDNNGWYALTKGDNLEKQDPFKVRFNDIQRIVVGIIY